MSNSRETSPDEKKIDNTKSSTNSLPSIKIVMPIAIDGFTTCTAHYCVPAQNINIPDIANSISCLNIAETGSCPDTAEAGSVEKVHLVLSKLSWQ